MENENQTEIKKTSHLWRNILTVFVVVVITALSIVAYKNPSLFKATIGEGRRGAPAIVVEEEGGAGGPQSAEGQDRAIDAARNTRGVAPIIPTDPTASQTRGGSQIVGKTTGSYDKFQLGTNDTSKIDDMFYIPNYIAAPGDFDYVEVRAGRNLKNVKAFKLTFIISSDEYAIWKIDKKGAKLEKESEKINVGIGEYSVEFGPFNKLYEFKDNDVLFKLFVSVSNKSKNKLYIYVIKKYQPPHLLRLILI